jgi:hypothetical protein
MQDIDVLVDKIKRLEAETTELEGQLKGKITEYKKLKDEELPQAMVFNNMADYTNLDGTKVSWKMDYRASTAEERMPEILTFLGKHQSASVFKKVVQIEIPFEPDGKLDVKLADKIVGLLNDTGVSFKESVKVLPQSLDAIIRRLYPTLDETDKATAKEVLKVSEYFKTTIKG